MNIEPAICNGHLPFPFGRRRQDGELEAWVGVGGAKLNAWKEEGPKLCRIFYLQHFVFRNWLIVLIILKVKFLRRLKRL